MFELDEFLHNLERVRERTRRVAACIPADRVEWTYKEGAFSLGDLVRHIAVTERFIWAETVHNRPVAYVSHGRELADGRDAVLAFFDRLHEESLAQFRALTPPMLGEKCVTPAGTPLTTWKWLRMMPEHEIHHRGQLYTMLGMLNVQVPSLYGMTASQVRQAGQKLEVRSEKWKSEGRTATVVRRTSASHFYLRTSNFYESSASDTVP